MKNAPECHSEEACDEESVSEFIGVDPGNIVQGQNKSRSFAEPQDDK